MRTLLSILRAAHCRSTHHHFAIDALPMIETQAGQRLSHILLRHHDRYLAGAKDPDTRFRDFHNHVVHVTDGYWGGAPAAAIRWYARLQALLCEAQWADAAHAAGVLSHYVTDPMQPLHTAQNEREKVIHRPLEWSITKSYASIRQQWLRDDIQVDFKLSQQTGWLAAAILHGARVAHRSYDLLVDSYDLEAGVQDPPRGLNSASRAALAELFGLTLTGWARIIERAAADAETTLQQNLPTQTLTLPVVLASLKIPHRLLLRRIEHKDEQAAVEALLEEYQRTGELQEHAPPESHTVRRSIAVYHRERAAKRAARAAASLSSQPTQHQHNLQLHRATHLDEARRLEQQRRAAMDRAERAIEQAESSRVGSSADDDAAPITLPFRPAASPAKSRLSVRAPIVDAPSIGPKTAARFQAIGIETVDDLLQASPETTARRLATRWIDAQRVADWQAQTELMCQLPEMRSRDVQLLVGSGFRSREKIGATGVDELYKAIHRFAVTSDGRRALRGAEPPSKPEIQRWADDAQHDRSIAA